MISDIETCGPEHQREDRRQTRAQCTGDPPTLPVPVSCGTRSLTAPALGNMSAPTPMRQSRPASESRRTSNLSMQTVGVVQDLRLGKQAAAAAGFSPLILGNGNVLYRSLPGFGSPQ